MTVEFMPVREDTSTNILWRMIAIMTNMTMADTGNGTYNQIAADTMVTNTIVDILKADTDATANVMAVMIDFYISIPHQNISSSYVNG